jgi:hypothetical protein
MSDNNATAKPHFADIVGLGIQELRSRGAIKGLQPLLRIDNRDRARSAPFQLDAATGKLHRRGCRSIPRSSRTALYGVWRIVENDKTIGCSRCDPMPSPGDKKDGPEQASDLFYGVLSVVNQFGSVLRERGQEYRSSPVGQVLGAQIDAMYRGVNERERIILDVVLKSIEDLANTLRDLDENITGMNGGAANGNGAKPNGHAAKANGSVNGHGAKKNGARRPRRAAKPQAEAKD